MIGLTMVLFTALSKIPNKGIPQNTTDSDIDNICGLFSFLKIWNI